MKKYVNLIMELRKKPQVKNLSTELNIKISLKKTVNLKMQVYLAKKVLLVMIMKISPKIIR